MSQKHLVITGQAGKGDNMEEMTDKERNDTKLATLYELRLMIEDDEKDGYTKTEILKLIDTVAKIKEQK